MSESMGTDSVSTEKFKRGGLGTVLLFIWICVILMLWGFAFYPTDNFSTDSSNVMARTQYVCFGTQANGLPAAQGWMLLILAPLALLTFMWATHAEELYAVPYHLKSSRLAQIITLVLISFLLIEGTWVTQRFIFAYQNSQDFSSSSIKNPFPEDYPLTNKPMPTFSLINQSGEKFSSDYLKNKVTILSFVFGHCSTVCPMLIKDVTEAHKKIISEQGSANVISVFITLDPWRDRPHSLPGIAKMWSLPENSYMLSGTPNEVIKVLKDFEIASERNPKNGDIIHAPQVMIINQNLKITYSFLNPTVDWIISATNRTLGK